jgi:hypothetical protein
VHPIEAAIEHSKLRAVSSEFGLQPLLAVQVLVTFTGSIKTMLGSLVGLWLERTLTISVLSSQLWQSATVGAFWLIRLKVLLFASYASLTRALMRKLPRLAKHWRTSAVNST